MSRFIRGAALFGAVALGSPARGAELLWQTNSAGDDVHVIDVETGNVERRLTVGPEPHGLAEARGIVYVSVEANDRSNGELVWIDAATGRIRHRLGVGPEPHEIDASPDGRWVYVPCRDGRYWVIDGTRRRVVKRIRTGGRPHNVVISRDGRFAYLAAMGLSRVMVVDIADGHRIAGEIPFADSVRPLALSEAGDLLFQQVDGLNGFQVADAAGRRTIATLEHATTPGWFLSPIRRLGWLDHEGLHRCHGLAVRPAAAEVWSICGSRVTIHSAREPGFSELSSLVVADDAYWLSFTPDGRFAFLALADRDQVAKVDARERRVVAYLPVGARPKRNLVLRTDGAEARN